MQDATEASADQQAVSQAKDEKMWLAEGVMVGVRTKNFNAGFGAKLTVTERQIRDSPSRSLASLST